MIDSKDSNQSRMIDSEIANYLETERRESVNDNRNTRAINNYVDSASKLDFSYKIEVLNASSNQAIHYSEIQNYESNQTKEPEKNFETTNFRTNQATIKDKDDKMQIEKQNSPNKSDVSKNDSNHEKKNDKQMIRLNVPLSQENIGTIEEINGSNSSDESDESDDSTDENKDTARGLKPKQHYTSKRVFPTNPEFLKQRKKRYSCMPSIKEANEFAFGNMAFYNMMVKNSKKSRDGDENFLPKDLGDASSLRRKSILKNISAINSNYEEFNRKENVRDQYSFEEDSKTSNDLENSPFPNTSKSKRNEESIDKKLSRKHKTQPDSENNKIIFENIVDCIKRESVFEKSDKKNKTNWKFSIFNLKKRDYRQFYNFNCESLNTQFDGDSEVILACINFSERELKTLLIDYLNVNPMIFYECTMLSPIDKIYEYNDEVIFYNLIMNKDNFEEDPLIMRIIRKGCFLVLIINHKEDKPKDLVDIIAETFMFKLQNEGDEKLENNANKIENLNIPSQDMEITPFPTFNNHYSKECIQDLKRKASIESDITFKVTSGEIGKVIIQNYKTVYPINEDHFTIDYILFWLANEDMKRIESWYNNLILNEIDYIQSQCKSLNVQSKIDFVEKLELVENHLIKADHAKKSKSKFCDKIINSSLASINLRYLIRYLMSRMCNLDNTESIIERKIQLAKNTKTSDASSALNNQMRMFTLISLMFLPLNVITGMWGIRN